MVPPYFYITAEVEEKQTGSPLCKASSGDACFVENATPPDAFPLEDAAKTCSSSKISVQRMMILPIYKRWRSVTMQLMNLWCWILIVLLITAKLN